MSKLEKARNISGKLTIVCGSIVSCLLIFQSVVAIVNKDYTTAMLNITLGMVWATMITDVTIKVIQSKKSEENK